METRTMPADGKIKIPGVYDIPIDVYHSQLCDGPSLSSSGIRRLLQSPALFWMYSDLNPNKVEEPESDALILGRAAHHLLLGEKDFGKTFVIQPATYYDKKSGEDKKWTYAALACKAWAAEQKAEGLTPVTPAQIEIIRGIAGLLPWQANMTNCGLKNTDLVMKTGILSGAIETSMLWKEQGVWLKSRPDSIPRDSDDVADLKTSNGVDDHSVTKSLFERGYHVQGALCGMAMSRVLGRQMAGFSLVYADKSPPYEISVRTLVPEDLILGERMIFVAIEIFKKCLATGIWPGSTADEHDAQKLSLPQYGRDQLNRRLDRYALEFSL